MHFFLNNISNITRFAILYTQLYMMYADYWFASKKKFLNLIYKTSKSASNIKYNNTSI